MKYIDADKYKADLLVGQEYLEENTFLTAINLLDCQPTANVVEVKHGRWETIPDYSQALTAYRHICSECKIVYKDIRPYGHNYCQNCGAKMDGKEE